eukprot:479322-Rhodomonas_salina.2
MNAHIFVKLNPTAHCHVVSVVAILQGHVFDDELVDGPIFMSSVRKVPTNDKGNLAWTVRTR